VENGGLEDRQIRDSPDASEDLRDSDGMVDVGRSIRVLASMIAMLIRRKAKGDEEGSMRKSIVKIARNAILLSRGCPTDRRSAAGRP